MKTRGPQEFRQQYGPWALVCGASEGLGAAFVDELAARGLHLILVARAGANLDAEAAALRTKHGVQSDIVVADVSRADDLERVLAACRAREVGLVVHVAALSPIGEFLDRPLAEHDQLVATNCRVPSLLAHVVGQQMVARGRGGIVIMSSMAALQGAAMVAHYSASKAYQRALAEGLWAELSPRGVDVIACLAGPTDTPTYRANRPVDKLGKPRAEWPPVLPPSQVVRETLAALGGGPAVIPGVLQRAVSFLLSRLLPRRMAVQIVSRSTRDMYPR